MDPSVLVQGVDPWAIVVMGVGVVLGWYLFLQEW